MLILAYNTLT